MYSTNNKSEQNNVWTHEVLKFGLLWIPDQFLVFARVFGSTAKMTVKCESIVPGEVLVPPSWASERERFRRFQRFDCTIPKFGGLYGTPISKTS